MSLFQRITQDSFARNVLTMMTGAGVAQIIPIAISPLLTRLYSPEDFGQLGLYLAITSIAAVVVTGRYELAILLPKTQSDAFHILALCLLLSSITSALLLLVVLFARSQIVNLLGIPANTLWLISIPITAFILGAYQSLCCWSIRKGDYRQMAVSRTLQSSSGSGTQLIGGYASAGALGLVGGQFVGYTFSSLLLFGAVCTKDAFHIRRLNWIRLRRMLRNYASFPKFMLAGQLANVASGQMPLILLGLFFTPEIAGYFALAQRVIASPMALVGNAIGEVFRSEAAKTYNDKGNCKALFSRTLVQLTVFSALATIPLFIFGPSLFGFFFGENWIIAGEIASIMSIMVFFQNISVPLSQTVLLAKMQSIDLCWQIARLIASIASLYIGYVVFSSYQIAILLFVLSFSLLYLAHSWLQYLAARGSDQ